MDNPACGKLLADGEVEVFISDLIVVNVVSS